MLAGIYYGAQYGGSTTAILINLPGESSSVVTALDGYRMAQQGRAGAALATAAIGSFFAGTVATFVIAFLAPPLSTVALKFQSPEYFSLMVLGLVASIVLAQGSLIKALGMVVLGLLLGLVGTDVTSGTARFAFGVPELADGINFVVVAMGVFGVAEIVRNLENERTRQAYVAGIGRLMPSREDARRIGRADPARHGAGLAARHPARRRRAARLVCRLRAGEEGLAARGPSSATGAIEGVAAPESANNAGAQTSFIPMLTLGIPSNPVMALMIGALIMQGIRPGPNVMVEQPKLFWGVIASMWVGNLFLLVLNLPMIGLWVRLLAVPYHLLYPIILVFSAVGVLSLSNAPVRRAPDGGVRRARLRLRQARLRAGAAAAGLHPRADDGGIPAPRHDALARRPDDLPRAPDQRGDAGGWRRWRCSPSCCRPCARRARRRSWSKGIRPGRVRHP